MIRLFRFILFTFCMALPALLPAQSPVESGKRLFICGHSFNWFIDKPLQALAKEAGYTDHQTLGKSLIGNSRPLQHWNLPDAENTAKISLQSGNVDVLTLALHREMPEPGVDLFADYAIQFNPHIRVMEQISWPDFPLQERTDWKKVPLQSEAYLKMARAQADAINRRHGDKTFVTLVPVVTAVIQLREKIEAGQMPGIKTFGELFIDPKGHPAKPLINLTTYCWYAAIYKKSPEGLKALTTPNDTASAEMNLILQQLAWNAVSQEPMSGVRSPLPTP